MTAAATKPSPIAASPSLSLLASLHTSIEILSLVGWRLDEKRLGEFVYHGERLKSTCPSIRFVFLRGSWEPLRKSILYEMGGPDTRFPTVDITNDRIVFTDADNSTARCAIHFVRATKLDQNPLDLPYGSPVLVAQRDEYGKRIRGTVLETFDHGTYEGAYREIPGKVRVRVDGEFDFVPISDLRTLTINRPQLTRGAKAE